MQMNLRLFLVAAMLLTAAARGANSAEPDAVVKPDAVLNLWPGKPPGQARDIGPEADLTKPEDRPIAGRPIIRLGNVTTPQIHVFLPPQEKRNGTALVVCPGGGFHILAWDLEGTEVAEWLNSIGVAAIVLKYRVPRQPDHASRMAVQDAQRAMSLARSKAADWQIATDRIGILGFSAGGFAAAHVAVQNSRRAYEEVDEVDKIAFRPDFAVAIYPGGIIDDKTGELQPDFAVTKETPPMFFVHAADDGVRCENSAQLFLALKKASVPSELHIYDAGGHGYGLRPKPEFPVTEWPRRCEEWLTRRGLLKSSS
jgi:acetyl esterase/lipase